MVLKAYLEVTSTMIPNNCGWKPLLRLSHSNTNLDTSIQKWVMVVIRWKWLQVKRSRIGLIWFWNTQRRASFLGARPPEVFPFVQPLARYILTPKQRSKHWLYLRSTKVFGMETGETIVQTRFGRFSRALAAEFQLLVLSGVVCSCWEQRVGLGRSTEQ
jgi:hypothetical protein